MKLANKVVIITGATSGIGEACALVFGKAGSKIVFSGRNQEKINVTLKLLQSSGIDAVGVKADADSEKDNQKFDFYCINYLWKNRYFDK
jgi:dehydrogenase/reductase SDR family member 7B